MNRAPSVLIVDRSEDVREVLATALARRGVRTFAASRVLRGLELAREVQPDLIVCDLETDACAARVCNDLASQCGNTSSRVLLLGTIRNAGKVPPEGEFVAKPYHYGPLIRRIEELVGSDRQASAVG